MKVFETFFEFCEIISILLKGMVYMMEKIKIGSHVGMAGKEMFLASVKEADLRALRELWNIKIA